MQNLASRNCSSIVIPSDFNFFSPSPYLSPRECQFGLRYAVIFMTSRGRGGKKRKLQDYSHSRQTGTCFLICVTASRARQCIASFSFLFTAFYRDSDFFSFFFFVVCLQMHVRTSSSWRKLFIADIIILLQHGDYVLSYFLSSCNLAPIATYCYNIK